MPNLITQLIILVILKGVEVTDEKSQLLHKKNSITLMKPSQKFSKKAMRSDSLVIDLCCGMGGLSLAAKNVGMRPLIGVDMDSSAIRTYSHNFKNVFTLNEDITDVETVKRIQEQLESVKKDFDSVVVLSGPPCQGFSMAGPRDSLDPRNRVLIAVANAISTIRPDMALIENVALVKGSKNKMWIANLNKAVSDAGYNVYDIELNAKDYGLAQNRRRVFFFITKKSLDSKSLEKFLESLQTDPVTVEESLTGLPEAPVRPEKYVDSDDDGIFPNHFSMKHSKKVQLKIAKIKPSKGPLSYRKLDAKGIARTLISGHRAPPAHYLYPRSITVREAARLQGFPDNFKVKGVFSKQMAQVTNAVPPPLGAAALKALLKFGR